jgi:prepilin-type N-terminal cleavage/methylation domain-containing protein
MNATQNKSRGFTIIELLTVMSIIVVLIGLLVPALNKVKRYAMDVSQQAQLHSIDTALALFITNQADDYPDSKAQDITGAPYCGAMKLAEAMMGQDLMGFHPESRFRLDGTDGRMNPTQIYEPGVPNLQENLKSRQGTSLPEDNANAFRLTSIYGVDDLGGSAFGSSNAGNMLVLCDVYKRVDNLGTTGATKIGMPILYYKADSSGSYHDVNAPATPDSFSNNGFIYNVFDNEDLVQMGKPWETFGSTQKEHSLSVGLSGINKFYEETQNDQILITSQAARNSGLSKRPYRADSFILISAGFDGEYGTADDIRNFKKK